MTNSNEKNSPGQGWIRFPRGLGLYWDWEGLGSGSELGQAWGRSQSLLLIYDVLTVRLALFVFVIICLSFVLIFDNCELFQPFMCFQHFSQLILEALLSFWKY